MKKMVMVRLLKSTSSTACGALRELNRVRAEAWVKAGWAEYVGKPPRSGRYKSEQEITGR